MSARRDAVTAKFDAWWCAVQKAPADAVVGLLAKLSAIVSGVEASVVDAGVPESDQPDLTLVLRPEMPDRRPVVAALARRVRERAAGWRVDEYLQGRELVAVEKEMSPVLRQTLQGLGAQPEPTDHRLVDVRILAGSQTEAASFDPIAWNTLSKLLGEGQSDWLGDLFIEVAPVTKEARLSTFVRRYSDVVESLRRLCPDAPLMEIRDQLGYMLYDLEAPSQIEAVNKTDFVQQEDLYVAGTAVDEVWLAVHSGATFSSRRFSEFGEHFCYIKIDGEGQADWLRTQLRRDLEDLLDEALIESGAGCVVGGGTGRRYSYIELAIVDFLEGIPALREILQDAQVSRRSWLQFHDASWAREWVGIYPETPEPFGLPE